MIGSNIALIGIGDLGGWILELLARSKGIKRITVCDLNEDWGKIKAFVAMAGATYFDNFPEVTFKKVDLNDIGRTAETLLKLNPDVIVNCTTLMSWWVRQGLSADDYRKLEDAGSGPWIPCHLSLTRKLMLALKEANLRTHVVNTCFADGVNAALGKAGLAPTIGGGNSDCLIPGLRKEISDQMEVPLHNIEIFMIAHHFHVMSLSLNQSMGGAPYYIRVMLGDRDITDEIDVEKALVKAVEHFATGARNHPLVASSFVKNILAIAHDTGQITHAAGPIGLPGGWPVRLSAKGAEVILPNGLSMQRAIEIVQEAQRFDGIARIKEDGTIVLTEKAYAIMKEMFGYDCQEFSLAESDERANELLSLFSNYSKKKIGSSC